MRRRYLAAFALGLAQTACTTTFTIVDTRDGSDRDGGGVDIGRADTGAQPADARPADVYANDAARGDVGAIVIVDVDGGPIDTGTIVIVDVDSGPIDSGPIDGGPPPVDAGPDDSGPIDSGPIDSGPIDSGPIDSGPPDTGPVDSGPRDSGPRDSGPPDTGPLDGGPPPVFEDLCTPEGASIPCVAPQVNYEFGGQCRPESPGHYVCVHGHWTTCLPVTTREICNNGVDDNGNGMIDDGCGCGTYEYCNGVDDNCNSMIDEGCSTCTGSGCRRWNISPTDFCSGASSPTGQGYCEESVRCSSPNGYLTSTVNCNTSHCGTLVYGDGRRQPNYCSVLGTCSNGVMTVTGFTW